MRDVTNLFAHPPSSTWIRIRVSCATSVPFARNASGASRPAASMRCVTRRQTSPTSFAVMSAENSLKPGRHSKYLFSCVTAYLLIYVANFVGSFVQNHEDVHASFNRYQCSLCEKRFKLRKSCLAHIRVHHSENERAGGGTGETTHQGQDQQQQLHTGTDEEGEMAVETLLAEAASAAASAEDDEDEEDEEGRQYVVTLAEDHDDAIDDQGIQLIQPGRIVAILPAGAEVECDETVETIVVEC